MAAEQPTTTQTQGAASAPAGDATASDVALTQFFETSSAARKAAAPLKKGAEVGVLFTDVPGEWRFTVVEGKPRLLKERAHDPDFVLTLAPGAVKDIASKPEADVGDLGITFFQHMIASEPGEKVRVKLHSGVIKLTMRGYLGVLSQGGPKVMMWMAQKGLKGPGAIASAISKLKK